MCFPRSRWLLILAPLALSVSAIAAPGHAVFGSVVAIGGSASDIALDETRGLLYIANFGGHTIQIMSTADNTIKSSINVLPGPGAIALSFDAQYLLIAHYCSVADTTIPPGQTSPACTNAITSIHLADQSMQVFSLANAPLGVAFLGNGQALIVTATDFQLFNPVTGLTQLVVKIANVSMLLPVPLPAFPGQIVQASLASSSDGSTIWGIASAGTSTQLVFQYLGSTNQISAVIVASVPPLLPRVSSSADGSYAMVGHQLVGAGPFPYLKGRYPDIISSANITGSAIDSANGIVYAQFPDLNQSPGPSTSIPASAAPVIPPAMLMMDADNLTFRDRISMPEDMVGRVVLNASATMMYAISESGVMILPVGSLNAAHRLKASQEDILVTTNFCNSALLKQSLTITDPGGGKTDFAITTLQPGVTVFPAIGVTPATVQVMVDPKAIAGSGGTTALWLTLTSQTAVNWPKPIRVLLNNPDTIQHGTIVNQPGVLSDILADAIRNVVYVLRQDMNQLLVFDGTSLNLIATVRTATSPTMMAMTNNGTYLLVGHDDSQLVTVYDLRTPIPTPITPVLLPGGQFARSIAVSNAAILALTRDEVGSDVAVIDTIGLQANPAASLTSLGIYVNSVSPQGVLTASPNGSNILYASPDGTVALYTAAANTFVNARQDFASLSGAFAVSDVASEVVGNSILNSSLVPSGVVSVSPLLSSGFTFFGQVGYMASAASSSAPGFIVKATLQTNPAGPVLTMASPVMTSEAPLLPTATALSPAISSLYGTYGSGGISTHAVNSFTRTVAPLPSGNVVMLTTSGLTLLAPSYPASALPSVSGIVSAADGSTFIAPGGLVSIYGQNLTTLSFAASAIPLPTTLDNSCIGVNGTPIPLLYVSPTQINAQLPFNATNNATLTVHSAAGVSNNYSITVQPTAPGVFLGGIAGPQTNLPIIVRVDNGQLVTPTNPIHPKDTVTIYLTGMGQTTPAVQTGQASPSNPLAYASVAPVVTLGGVALSVGYGGLVPGEVGVDQINATAPSNAPAGLSVPLVITQGSGTTTLYVRVVN